MQEEAMMNTNRIGNVLRANYPLNHTLESRLKTIFCNGLAVFLFLLIFKPFGMVRMSDGRLLQIAVGFGMVCSLVLVFDVLLLPKLLPRFYNKERWKVYHQILRVGWQITAVAVANVVYAALAGAAIDSVLKALFRSYLAAVTFALAPITIGIVSFRYRATRQHSSESKNVTCMRENPSSENGSQIGIVLRDEQGCKKLRLKAEHLLCICAAQNYVEVVCLKNGRTEKTLVRSSLKRIETDLQSHPAMFRCHRRFLVNLSHVVSNAVNQQGSHLLLTTGMKIPVSRRRKPHLQERLESQGRHRWNGNRCAPVKRG